MQSENRQSGSRPTSRNLRPLVQLAAFLKPYPALLGVAFASLLIAAAATLVLPIKVRQMIDLGFLAENVKFVDQYFLELFVVAMVLAGGSAARFYFVARIGERVVADIRKKVHAHVLKMNPTFFEVTRSGEVLSRLTTDTTLIQTVIGAGASIALRNIVLFFGGLVLLIFTSPKLMAMVVIVLPLVMLPVILLGRRVRRLSRASQDRIADTSALAGESLEAIETVQAFVQEAKESDRFGHAAEHAYRTAMVRIWTRAWLIFLVITIMFGGVVLVLWRGAQAVLQDQMTEGDLAQFVLYAVLVAGAAGVLSQVWGEVQRAAGAAERLLELLEEKPVIRSPDAPQALPEPPIGKVTFASVGFHYPSRPAEPALEDFSLEINPGETVALVGPSGAGKSTVFKLLLRFYDPQRGSVHLDGVDLKRAGLKEVRERIGLVPQETVVFSADALENIRYGRPSAADDEIFAAARAAFADDFIRRLPQGYETFLGERGLRLSTGQRQRIAIARAILKNPSVMLLDEATSSLDAESERLIHDALEHLMEHRTTLIIAHRLATVLKADRIVVLDRGRIVAAGNHEDLRREGGLYARLAALQFAPES